MWPSLWLNVALVLAQELPVGDDQCEGVESCALQALQHHAGKTVRELIEREEVKHFLT